MRTPELVERSGATLRQVNHWYDIGAIVPSIRVGHGSGSQHEWSEHDAEVVRILVRLASLGCTSEDFCRAALALRERTLPHVGWLVACPGGNPFIVEDFDDAFDRGLGRACWIVAIDKEPEHA